jgi:hypothetical protein
MSMSANVGADRGVVSDLILSDDRRMESPSVHSFGALEIEQYVWHGTVKVGAVAGTGPES